MSSTGLFHEEQIAERHNLPVSAIRKYAASGLLHAIELDEGVFFTARDVMRLEVIEKGRKLGFSLAAIKMLIGTAEPPRD